MTNWLNIVVAPSRTFMTKFHIHPPTTQEESAAKLVPNSCTPLVEIVIEHNLPNKAVSFKEAQFHDEGDNIANFTHEESVTEHFAPSEECHDTRIQRSVAIFLCQIMTNWLNIVVAPSRTFMTKFHIHPPTTQEESAAKLVPNSCTPLVEIVIEHNLPNKAVSFKEAQFHDEGDNIANFTHEESVTGQSCCAPSEECPDTRIQRSVAIFLCQIMTNLLNIVVAPLRTFMTKFHIHPPTTEPEYKKHGMKICDIETAMTKYCPEFVRQISINDIKSVLHERMQAIYIVHDNQRPMSHATLLRTFRNVEAPFYFDSNGGCPENINKIVDWNHFKVQADENNTCAIHCIYVAIKLSEGKSWPEILQEYGHGNCDDKDNKVIHFLENLT